MCQTQRSATWLLTNKSTVLESLSVNSHLLVVLYTRQRTRLGCKMKKTRDVLMGIWVKEGIHSYRIWVRLHRSCDIWEQGHARQRKSSARLNWNPSGCGGGEGQLRMKEAESWRGAGPAFQQGTDSNPSGSQHWGWARQAPARDTCTVWGEKVSRTVAVRWEGPDSGWFWGKVIAKSPLNACTSSTKELYFLLSCSTPSLPSPTSPAITRPRPTLLGHRELSELECGSWEYGPSLPSLVKNGTMKHYLLCTK